MTLGDLEVGRPLENYWYVLYTEYQKGFPHSLNRINSREWSVNELPIRDSHSPPLLRDRQDLTGRGSVSFEVTILFGDSVS